MTLDYRQSHIHPDKGYSYHSSFSSNPYRKMIWNLEKKILYRVVQPFSQNKQLTHLDFACGTGRILSFLERYTHSSIGVDVSPSMLKVAKSICVKSELFETDLTQNDVLINRNFDLITAFRFFPNAQVELRNVVLKILSNHLKPGGLLIFNNHLNSQSLHHLTLKWLRKRQPHSMGKAEVSNMLGINNLRVLNAYPLCILPVSEARGLPPMFIAWPIEYIYSRLQIFPNLGMNVIYVCTHVHS